MVLAPYQEAPSPPMTPALKEACARALHVVTAEGAVLRGGDASLWVLRRTTPGWRRLAKVLSVPPLRWAVRAGYHLVARNRRLVARWVLR